MPKLPFYHDKCPACGYCPICGKTESPFREHWESMDDNPTDKNPQAIVPSSSPVYENPDFYSTVA